MRHILKQVAWAWLDVSLALLAIASIVGFAARQWWLFELCCHFRAQYFVLLAAGAVLLLWRRSWYKAATAGMFSLVNLALLLPLYLPSGVTPPKAASTYRLLSYNVNEYGFQFASTLALIHKTQPDIVVLVEIDYRWLQELAELERVDGYHMVQRRGVAIYSRFPIEMYELPDRAPVGMPSALSHVTIAGQRVTLIGAHPSSPDGRGMAAQRNSQLADLARFATAAERPLIVVGDLNTTSWSPYFSDLVRAANLRDSRRGFGIQPTFPVPFPPALIPIDHCLVSEGIHVHSRRVAPASGSDHYPILIEFSVEKQ